MNTDLNVAVTVIPNNTLERKLSRLRELKDAEKVIKAEFDMIKQELIDGYFCQYEEYRNKKGLLLATYKSIESMRFETTDFKETHPDLYKKFSKTSVSYRFDLK